MELIVVLCKESKNPSHEVCNQCPVHRVHMEVPAALVCLDPSEDTAQQLKAILEEKFKKKGIVFDPRPIRYWAVGGGTPFLSREGEEGGEVHGETKNP